MKGLLGICLLLISLPMFAQDLVREIGTVKHGPINEISGIVQSVSYPGRYWVHNDSGDSARLFAIEADGTVIYPQFLRNVKVGEGNSENHWQGMTMFMAANQDWEDIALDNGLLYLADVGNNGNARRDLGVYIAREPNPAAITNVRPFKYLPIEYPDQETYPAKRWHFDSESLFVDDGTMYFVTKHRQPGKISEWERGAKLYRLDTQHTDQVNQLTYIETHPEVAVATGADLSPDGQWLAIICYADIWLFKRPEFGDAWLSGDSYRLPLTFRQTGQVEAISWQDNNTLIFTNEPGQLFEVNKQAIIEQAE
jgi:hypothetical protein